VRRYLGVDLGARRIGLSVSDELGLTAQALPTLEGATEPEARAAIRRLIDEYEIGEVVVGLPKNMNGTIGPAAERALEFARRLGEESGTAVTMWDERLTSRAAERAMLEGKLSRSKRRRSSDRVAAMLILQGFLDRRRREREPAS
jgi:putative Holliday junction resolvase